MKAGMRQLDGLRLTPDLTVGEGLQEMLAGALGACPTGLPGPEPVHRFRVAVRRLRSILSAVKDALPNRERRALDDHLRAIAERFGRAREWDVFLAATLAPLMAALPEERERLGEVQCRAAEARRQALPPGDSLKSAAAEIEAAIADAVWLRRPGRNQAARWDTALPKYAAAMLDRRHRRLGKRLKHLDGADAETLHTLRVRVKKLRYPAELLASLFEKDARPYVKRVVALQDVLGKLHDAAIAVELIGGLDIADDTRQLIRGWALHQSESCRPRLARRARAFRKAEPFWDA